MPTLQPSQNEAQLSRCLEFHPLCAGWLLCWQRWQVLICIKFCAVSSWGLLREPGVSNHFPAVLQGKWWFPQGSVSGSVTHAGAEDPFPTHWDVDSLFPAAHSKPALSHPMHHGWLEEVGQTPHGIRWIFPRVISQGCQPDVKLRLCSPPTRLVTACLWKWAKPLLLILEITDPQSELSYTREYWEYCWPCYGRSGCQFTVVWDLIMACTYECWWQRQSRSGLPAGSRILEEEDVCSAICSWKQGKACTAEVLIGLLCLFSGHPGLWDVLPGGGVAAGEEADRHRWHCLLWLPQRERHLPVPGREWHLPCERWRPPWIHREFTHLLSLCRTLLWQGPPLAWSESKEQMISSYCTGTGSDLDNPGSRVIHRDVFPWL